MEETIQRNAKNYKKNFHYDDFSDSLMVFNNDINEKVEDNYILGDFIISLNESGEVVGLEIRGVSYLLENYEINPKILDNLEDVQLKVSTRGQMIYISLNFESNVDTNSVKQKLPLIMPIHQDFLS
tara:strand:- start:71 stop:448 length:378 start_codon:yes stop_codon:yes gene_type:complete